MSTTTQQGGSGPPPKPWERAESSSGPTPFRPSSGGATSDVVESSGTAKPGEIVSTSNQNNSAVNTNIAGRPLPSRPWESSYGNTSYGGYGSGLTSGATGYGTGYGSGSGMYNSYGGGYGGVGGGIGGVGGMYGSSMYRGAYGGGGGLYGSSGMYGGLGGGGMYNSGMGGPMGGYGMGGGPYGPPDPNNPPASPPGFWISFLRVMEGVVNFFGRISVLVDQNTQAVHLFMSALLQLCNQGGMLYGELALFVLKILGRRRSKKLHPTGPNGLPLPGPDGQMDQRLIEGPKGPPAGPWDNVWGNGPNR